MYGGGNSKRTPSSMLGGRGGVGLLGAASNRQALGGGSKVAASSLPLSSSSASAAAVAGTGRMAKYANPAVDGTYKASHHNAYRTSGWIKVSRVNRFLTEGDLVTVFSQFGDVVDVRFSVREFDGQPTGFAFLEFLNPISAVVACDAMNSSPLGNIAAASAAAAANNKMMDGATQASDASDNAVATGFPSFSSSSSPRTQQAPASSSSAQNQPQPFICRLLPTDAVGIEVDHCDAGEVPTLKEGVEGYGHWFHQEVFVAGVV